MSRGLSTLQQEIISWAWNQGAAILVSEIISNLWQARADFTFSRDAVSPAEYEKTHITISRSIERLRRRGLTRTFKDVTGAPGTLVYLTDAGIEVAQELEQKDAPPE